ncbi:hypothetical protein K501DRAFT_181531 [Backusella circina FSU 941]|nr:hypothetical protein K501DRAFT_181531 [Backusella circina FSU 941]
MGLMEKLKNNYDYYKAEKYTKRRLSHSQFESHDRRYYESVYCDGDYHYSNQSTHRSLAHLSYRDSKWSLPDLFKKSKKNSLSGAISTSETYTFQQA